MIECSSSCPCPQHEWRADPFTPFDITLPLFSYGIFQPGELGFLALAPHIASCERATIPGELRIRDGMPILDKSREDLRLDGFLLHFITGHEKGAYEQIAALEPKKHYVWDTVEIRGVNANVLYGRVPKKGSKHLDDNNWVGRNDPFFKEAIEVVEEVLEQVDRVPNWSIKDLFRLQMAYLLLWSAIERYATFRYEMRGAVLQTVRRLAEDSTFVTALRDGVTRRASVYKADDPGNVARLNVENPKACIDFYYQVRCNITHRGKALVEDYDLVNQALRELLVIFKYTKDSAFDESLRIRNLLLASFLSPPRN